MLVSEWVDSYTLCRRALMLISVLSGMATMQRPQFGKGSGTNPQVISLSQVLHTDWSYYFI